MSQSFAEALSWVPKSRGLAAALARAHDYARSRSHGVVTLEHLLLALTSDRDAGAVLQACAVDLDRLNSDVASFLSGNEERLAGQPGAEPTASPELVRIIEYATAAARQSRRREVNGAIVLAAIVGDGQSPAAGMLRATVSASVSGTSPDRSWAATSTSTAGGAGGRSTSSAPVAASAAAVAAKSRRQRCQRAQNGRRAVVEKSFMADHARWPATARRKVSTGRSSVETPGVRKTTAGPGESAPRDRRSSPDSRFSPTGDQDFVESWMCKA